MSLVLAQFVALFCQTSLEAVIPAVVLDYYGFGQLKTSFFYMGLTGYLLVAFVVVGLLTKCITDRNLVLLGWVFAGCGMVTLSVSELWNGPMRFWQLAFGSAIFSTSVACFETAVGSLFSKLVERRSRGVQGTAQSFLMTMQALAVLVAPLVSDPILGVAFRWVLVTLLILWVGSFLFFLYSYPRLRLDPIASSSTEPVPFGGVN